MQLVVEAAGPAGAKPVAWVSFQPGGAISVGLRDRTFISPAFHSRSFLWNVYNRVTTEYLIPHTPDALIQVLNPHLTFHPPIYFHLRQNAKEELFAGIADVRIMLEMDSEVPWVRFTSGPYESLPTSTGPRLGIPTDSLQLELPGPEFSIGVGVNFVTRKESNHKCSRLIEHGGLTVEVFAEVRPLQQASLSWYHQS